MRREEMPERVLSLPLSGLEVRKAILDKISQALSRDCYLNDDTAYDYFSANVKISLSCHDIGRIAKVEIDQTASAGSLEENQFLEQAETELNLESTSANETRVETGQPVPVAAKDIDGKESIRPVHYPRKAVGKGAK
jgi:hypothetical protein